MSALIEDKVTSYVIDHPGHTAAEIALAVRSRRQTVEEILRSPIFTRSQDSDKRITFAVAGHGPQAASGDTGQTGTRRKPETHVQRVLRLLSDGKPHTHHELYNLHVIAHSRVADLRRDGYTIEQWREGDSYMYRLVGSPLDAASGASPDPSPDAASSGLEVPSASELAAGPLDFGPEQLRLTGPAFRRRAA